MIIILLFSILGICLFPLLWTMGVIQRKKMLLFYEERRREVDKLIELYKELNKTNV